MDKILIFFFFHIYFIIKDKRVVESDSGEMLEFLFVSKGDGDFV